MQENIQAETVKKNSLSIKQKMFYKVLSDIPYLYAIDRLQ